MPELPEVETVLRGLYPHLHGCRLLGAELRESRLRWPVPAELDRLVAGRTVRGLSRRGKYLLLQLDRGGLLIHLGMSGSLRLLDRPAAPGRHDHLDLILADGRRLRLRDPRRFGAVLHAEDPSRHPLLAGLGIEPLEDGFDGASLHRLTRGRRVAVKQFLMDARQIVGIGNIYANEALYRAGIDPRTPAGRLGRERCERLATAIRETLEQAIAAGGSSLRDFVGSHGEPGWFQQDYAVYGREGLPCRHCAHPIRRILQGGRATFFCPRCQRR